MTLDVQMQLDEVDSSSVDDDNDMPQLSPVTDDDMPQLSPVTDISTSSFTYPSYSAVTSSTSACSVVQPSSSAIKSPRRKLSIDYDGYFRRLHCICRTPYDDTKYVVASFVIWLSSLTF